MMTDETAQDNQPAPTPARRGRQRTHGQSIVEFAFVLPLMLLFLVIAADFGRAYTAYLTISSSAREGATYASRSSDNAANTGEIETRAKAEVGPDGEIWNEPITVTPSDCSSSDPQGYDCIQVTVDYTFKPIFLIGPIPDEVEMQRTVRMRVLGS